MAMRTEGEAPRAHERKGAHTMEYTETSLAKQFVALKGDFDNEVHTRTEWKTLLKQEGHASLEKLETCGFFSVCGTEEYTYKRYDRATDSEVEAIGTRELLKLADKLNVRENRIARVIAAKCGALESPEHACEWSAATSPAHREYEATMSSLEREFNEGKQKAMCRCIEQSKKERELMNAMRGFIRFIDYEN